MTRRLGGVISVTPPDYETFLDELERLAPTAAAEGVVTSHTRLVLDEETRHLTARALGTSMAMTATALRSGERADRRLLAVALDEGTEHELGSSILAAAGIRPELARDAFTNEPLSPQGYQPMYPDGFAHGLKVWLATSMPSTVVFVRSDNPPASKVIPMALRSVPGPMRGVTPVVVVNAAAADCFATFLTEVGIAPVAKENAVVLQFAGGGADDVFRTRNPTEGRRLNAAILAALEETADKLDAYFEAATVDVRTSDDAGELAALERRVEDATQVAARAQATAARLEADLSKARRRVRELEYELGYVESPTVEATDDTDPDTDPAQPVATAEPAADPWATLPAEPDVASFAELLEHARDRLHHLVLPDSLDRAAVPLEADPSSARWRRRSWYALALLDAYAVAKSEGDPAGSFRAWLAPRPHPVIQEAHVRSSETQTIQGSRKLRDSRTFPVPEAVDPSGRAVFLTHVRIETGGSGLVPRLHFYDDTRPGGTGLVYIGHLGPHLRTRRTN